MIGGTPGCVEIDKATADKTPLAIDKVRYIGDEVAAVAAIDERTRDGTLLAKKCRHYLDAGAYGGTGKPANALSIIWENLPYKILNIPLFRSHSFRCIEPPNPIGSAIQI